MNLGNYRLHGCHIPKVVISLTILAANHIKDFLCIIGIIYSVKYLMICQSGVSCFSQQSTIGIIPGNHFTRLIHK